MTEPTKPTSGLPPTPAPAPAPTAAETQAAQVKPAADPTPSCANTVGKICPQTSPASKSIWQSIADWYMDRRKGVLAEGKGKEDAAEAALLILTRGGSAAGSAIKGKGAIGKTTPTTTHKPETPKTEPAKVEKPKAETQKPAEKPQEATATATPAQGSGGGYSVGNSRAEKGKCGEWLAKQDLHNEGYTDIIEVQNNSGHGVDVMGRNANGDVRVLEVKTTDGATAPPLSKDQASMGGKDYTDSRLGRAADGKGHYKNSPDAIANGQKGQEWLKSAEKGGKKVSYEKYDVFVEDPKEGCIKKKAKSSTWDKKPKQSPRRR